MSMTPDDAAAYLAMQAERSVPVVLREAIEVVLEERERLRQDVALFKGNCVEWSESYRRQADRARSAEEERDEARSELVTAREDVRLSRAEGWKFRDRCFKAEGAAPLPAGTGRPPVAGWWWFESAITPVHLSVKDLDQWEETAKWLGVPLHARHAGPLPAPPWEGQS